MNELEIKLRALLAKANKVPVNISDELIEEFGTLCKNILVKQFNTPREKEFRLRMSNIGKDLRQLHMDKLYGEDLKSPEFKLLVTYGDIIEAMITVLLKASGVDIVGESGKVELDILGETIKGEYDHIYKDQLTGENYLIDIKSCSPHSFEHKFKDYESFKEEDSFGYRLQGWGYNAAKKDVDSSCFKGLFVVNKVSGEFKFLEVEDERQEALKDITKVVDHFKNDRPLPPCPGVKEETWYGKKTGEKVIACGTGEPCQFCPRKDKCHPEAEYRLGEKGKTKKWFLDKDKEVTYEDSKQKS